MQVWPLSKQRGFTIIEVLVAVAILSVLAAIAIPSYLDVRKTARDKQRISDIAQLQLAFRMYRDANGSLPTHTDPARIDGIGSPDDLIAPYLGGIVKDPLDTGTGTYGYFYQSNSVCPLIPGTRVVLYAQSMEKAEHGNWATVCGGTPPGTNSYVVILK